jgi:hypothetical protein
MPYQVKVGSMTAIVANEQEALEMIRRMARSTDEHPLIKDIFGTEVDIETTALMADPASTKYSTSAICTEYVPSN